MTMKVIKTTGELLRENREKKGLLLRQVAALLNIDTAILSKVERRERKANKEQIIKLAEILDLNKEELMVEFSVLELKLAYESGLSLFKLNVDLDDVEDALFYLSRIEAIKIEGGFLVVYNRLTIDRLEQDNRKKYTKEEKKKNRE